jgi:hypothetical protein
LQGEKVSVYSRGFVPVTPIMKAWGNIAQFLVMVLSLVHERWILENIDRAKIPLKACVDLI